MEKLNNLWKSMNARQEPDEILLENFIAQDIFWDRISSINEIIIGTSGSGKTALMRMLSHSLLSRFDNPKAKQIIDDKKFIGVYIPMLMFLGNINELNALEEREQQNFFIQAFNYMACKSFITSIKSCLKTYDYQQKEKLEKEIVEFLSSIWLAKKIEISTLSHLHDLISQDWLSLQSKYRNKIYCLEQEITFNLKFMSFFSPISTSIDKIIDLLKLPKDTIFAILIDEAEFLSKVQKREVNSLLRSEQRPFVFKIATLPFTHLNMETKNSKLPLRENQDFQFFSIDFIHQNGWREDFKKLVNEIYTKRLKDSNYSYNKLEDIFGNFDYVDHTVSILKNIKTYEDLDKLFLQNLSTKREFSALKERHNNDGKRDNKITNKYLPIFCTKKINEYYHAPGRGKPSWFSGFNTIINISEGNIRRFINIMGLMFNKLDGKVKLSDRIQHQILIEYSKRENEITRNLISEEAYKFMMNLAKSLEKSFYRKLFSESATSFKVNWNDLSEIKPMLVELISFGRIIPERYTGVSIKESGIKMRISYLYILPFWIILRAGVPLSSPDIEGNIKIPKKLKMEKDLNLSLFTDEEIDND